MRRIRRPAVDKQRLEVCGTQEIFDAPEVLEYKVKQLAYILRESKYSVIFTGAGISTSAGIPDYRGPAGVWTLKAQGKEVAEPNFLKLKPTRSHKAVQTLVAEGLVQHVVSQNVDGLHRRSGLKADQISEIHGNYCLERCPSCKEEYFRSYAVWKGLTSAPGCTALSAASATKALNQEGQQFVDVEPGSGHDAKPPNPKSSGLHDTTDISTRAFVTKRPRSKKSRAPKNCTISTACLGGPNFRNSRNGVIAGDGRAGTGMRLPEVSEDELLSANKRTKVLDGSQAGIHDHRTGRRCSTKGCGAELVDSVVLFGEDLPEQAVKRAELNSDRADLAFVIGSSLRVSPARDFPASVAERGGTLVIVNLQRTPLDSKANLVIHARCDEVMTRLLHHLGLSRRQLQKQQQKQGEQLGKEKIEQLEALEFDDLTASSVCRGAAEPESMKAECWTLQDTAGFNAVDLLHRDSSSGVSDKDGSGSIGMPGSSSSGMTGDNSAQVEATRVPLATLQLNPAQRFSGGHSDTIPMEGSALDHLKNKGPLLVQGWSGEHGACGAEMFLSARASGSKVVRKRSSCCRAQSSTWSKCAA